jgi:hypothetical protein
MQTLRAADLKPGDVLLFQGNGLLSRFIRFFDGSQYSHAGIFDGEHVIEAEAVHGTGAVEVHEVAESCSTASFTHVYRYVDDDRKRLGIELPYEPVGGMIEQFKASAESYAYSQILLLGVLLGTRRIPIPGVTGMLRHILDEAAEWLNAIITEHRKIVICSELVYECFNSVPNGEYQLDIAGVDPEVVAGGLSPRHMLMPGRRSRSSRQGHRRVHGHLSSRPRNQTARRAAAAARRAGCSRRRASPSARRPGIRHAARPRNLTEPGTGRPIATVMTMRSVPASMLRRLCAAALSAAFLCPPAVAAAKHPKTVTQAPVTTGSLQLYATASAAQAHCPRDVVVWLNTNSGIYHEKGDALVRPHEIRCVRVQARSRRRRRPRHSKRPIALLE